MPRKPVDVSNYDREKNGRTEHVDDYTRDQQVNGEKKPSMLALRRHKFNVRVVHKDSRLGDDAMFATDNVPVTAIDFIEAYDMARAKIQDQYGPAESIIVVEGHEIQPGDNTDFNMDLFRFQDANMERQPKRMDNRSLGLSLEHAGDIFREQTGRTQPDDNYSAEKVERLQNILYDPYDSREIAESELPGDYALSHDVRNGWINVPEGQLSPELSAVKQLNIALSERDVEAAKRWLKQYQELRGV